MIIKDTSMNVDQQKQAVEIANMALDTCRMENEIATYIKREMDELLGGYRSDFWILVMSLVSLWEEGGVGFNKVLHFL